jgi:hypothetical protein
MATILFWEAATLTPVGALFKICRAVRFDQASPDFNGMGRREAAPLAGSSLVLERNRFRLKRFAL